MATNNEVLAFLRPEGKYVQVGQEYEGITFLDDCEPFTKSEYEAAFDLVDNAKKIAETQLQEKKENALQKLNALGLTLDDLKALGLG